MDQPNSDQSAEISAESDRERDQVLLSCRYAQVPSDTGETIARHPNARRLADERSALQAEIVAQKFGVSRRDIHPVAVAYRL